MRIASRKCSDRSQILGVTLTSSQRNISPIGAATSRYLPRGVRRLLAVREMRARSVTSLAERAFYLRFAQQITAKSGPNQVLDGPVWQYWNSSRDRAPELMRRCFNSVDKWTAGRKHHVLSDDTLSDFVELPSWIIEKRHAIGHTHFSDILRVSLLSRYGGTWIDASVFLSGRIDDLVDRSYFAFSRPNDPYLLSSWFMHSAPGHPISIALADMLSLYWKESAALRDYFAIHYMFECGVTIHRELRSAWLETPVRWADAPHWIQSNFGGNPDDHVLRSALENSRVHKLTWKLDTEMSTLLLRCLDRLEVLF